MAPAAGPLTLSPPTPEDLEHVLTWRNSSQVTRWLLLTTVDPETYKRNWLEEDDDDIAVVAHVDGQIVGTGSLGIQDAMGQAHAGESTWRRAQGHLGYTIDPRQAGRGYATHLARSLLSMAFEDLGLHRVVAGCFADKHPLVAGHGAAGHAAGATRDQGLVARRARVDRWLHLRDPAR